MDKTPPTGGDTIFTSQVALFDKLSTTYQKLLEGLHGVHSSEVRILLPLTLSSFIPEVTDQHIRKVSYINVINGGGKAFRPPTRQEHPLVTTTLHPEQLKGTLY